MPVEKTEQPQIEVTDVQPVTPHNEALYEAGKKLLVDSIDVGRKFCEFMITTSLSAIPLYLGLLKLVLPNNYSLQTTREVAFLFPVFLFLIATGFFAYGYFPQSGQISLDLPHDIENARNRTIRHRHLFAILGSASFAIALALSAFLLVESLSYPRA